MDKWTNGQTDGKSQLQYDVCGQNTIPIGICDVDEANDGKIMGPLPAGHAQVQ